MKNSLLKFAVLGALSVTASSAMAAFELLPTSGATAYKTCFAGSNYGAQGDAAWPPVGGTCVAPNGGGAALLIASVPEAGFAASGAGVSSPITAFAETVATLNERVWRNAGTSQCIYGKQVIMSNTAVNDYNPQKANSQKMEVNDFAFGGYTGTVSVAYAKQLIGYSSAYRVGRTFTSVQMQPNVIGGATIAAGFLALPTAAGTLGTEIYGFGQTTGISPAPAPGTAGGGLQQAPFSGTHNWVDFTTDVTAAVDEDGTTNPASPNMYIKQSCASGAVTATAGNFKMRQTGQETQPWITVTGTSRAPGTSVAP
ncbi:MAG: hypothetical protein CTY37_00045 [Methylotenera sp.]|nr:MAG: hypothetical protein CTY37_00045 [Methylotenera sp.]